MGVVSLMYACMVSTKMMDTLSRWEADGYQAKWGFNWMFMKRNGRKWAFTSIVGVNRRVPGF